jgi:hypothetical protein
MSIVEKALNAELRKIDKRLNKVQAILDESPHVAILELYQKAQKIMEENKGDYKKIGELIEPMAGEEKRLRLIAKQQKGSRLWDERLKLEMDQERINSELYYINVKKAITA